MQFRRFDYDVGRIPQQQEFIFSNSRYPSYFGGFNNGKTFALCLRAWIHSLSYRNNRGVIARRLVKELRDTTRHEFFKIVGCNESTIGRHPLVERWNGSENMLRLKNGSEVYFRHLADEEALASLLSLSLRWFGMDQAEEIPEAAFLTLISRIGRTDVDPSTGEKLAPAWGATVGNPAGHNWVWKRWKRNDVERLAGRKHKPNYHLVEATTMDNPFASKEYIAELLDNYSSHWIQRYVYGSWDAFKGQVYEEFSESVHVIDPFPIPQGWKVGLGMDRGYNHPTAFIWVAIDYEGNWYIFDEHVEREKLPPEHAAIIKAHGITDSNGDQYAIFGPHDMRNRNTVTGINEQQAYLDAGVSIMPGHNQPAVVGIQQIKAALKIDENRRHPRTGRLGSPKLFVTRNCERIIEEFGLYRWKDLRPGQEEEREQPDEVVKVDDDALDAFRYWVMGWTSRYAPVRPREKTVYEADFEAFLAEEAERSGLFTEEFLRRAA